MATDGSLSEIQSQALKMLMGGATVKEVARQLGKGERTIHRWRGSPAFKKALSQINQAVESQAISESVSQISKIKSLAIDVIEECLSNREESMRNRLNAARLAQNLTSPMPIELGEPPPDTWNSSQLRDFHVGELEKIARAALSRGDEASVKLGVELLDKIAKITGVDEPLGRSIDNVLRAGYLIQDSDERVDAEAEVLLNRLSIGVGYKLPRMSREQTEALVDRVQSLVKTFQEEIARGDRP